MLTTFSVTVAFPLVDDRKTSLLAWTTTPWTLPSNLALCVHPEYTYIKIYDEQHDQNFILHENLLRTLYKDPKKAKFKKLGTFKGSDMKGWRYVPLFEYFTEQARHPFACILTSRTDPEISLRTALSVCSTTTTSPPRMVRVSSTRLLRLVRTITGCALKMVSSARTRCRHAPSTTPAGLHLRSRISSGSTSRYV